MHLYPFLKYWGDRTKLLGGMEQKYWGDISPPSPPGFAPLRLTIDSHLDFMTSTEQHAISIQGFHTILMKS